MSLQRELPLALFKCDCGLSVASVLQAIPKCRHCDEIPSYQGETDWAITFEEWFPGD